MFSGTEGQGNEQRDAVAQLHSEESGSILEVVKRLNECEETKGGVLKKLEDNLVPKFQFC